MVALVGRDTCALALTSAQRLSHFPASPLVTISWFSGMDGGLVSSGAISREELQHALHLRHRTAQVVRAHLASLGFWEIDTPMLTRRTPE